MPLSHDSNPSQIGLFGQNQGESEHAGQNVRPHDDKNTPLAFKSRPETMQEFIGQEHLFKKWPFLNTKGPYPSMVFHGPPGTGKTTLAYLLAQSSDYLFFKFNAVLAGVAELKKIIKSCVEAKQLQRKNSIIFIDEIHRFNKAQQDALLPHIEAGTFTLIGATTENPRSALNKALLSRLQTIQLKELNQSSLLQILNNSILKNKISIEIEAIQFLADYGNGDARFTLNTLETVFFNHQTDCKIQLDEIKDILLSQNRTYDKNQDRHFEVISAFIKSMRGSDPDAALMWLAVMLDGGEDPVYIARRIVIFAAEDIGNADLKATELSIAILTGVKNIGMPEARILLAQAVTYLSATVKSNAAYIAINQAMEYVQSKQTLKVPDHLKNFPPPYAAPYLYPHNYPASFTPQKYTDEEKLPVFYRPTQNGTEKNIAKRLTILHPTRHQ